MFLDLETIARVERAEARLVAEGGDVMADMHPEADFTVIRGEDDGGWAVSFSGEYAPFTKWAGIGFGPLPDLERFDMVESQFDLVQTPVTIELATGANPELLGILAERGYRLRRFENVLVRGLSLDGLADLKEVSGPEVALESDQAGFSCWLDGFLDAFTVPDGQGVADSEEFPRTILGDAITAFSRCRGFRRYRAALGGRVVGRAAMRLDPGGGLDAKRPPILMLCGAATDPEWRRQGLQTALLHARLRDAAKAGADLAAVTTLPGSKSEENAVRAGFKLGYVRAHMVRPVGG